MDSSPCIEQKGVIEEITDGLAKVRITSFSACANCLTKDSCGLLSGGVNKHIEIPDSKGEFQKGETVFINMRRSMGLKATLIAYIIPFFLIILTLLMLTSIRLKELYAGLISLSVLIPYFTGLYFFRDHLRRTFIFTMRKAI